MATFPLQIPRTYVNPSGNLSASGYYRSYIDQELSNMFPQWMHIRENPRSVGQQFMSPIAMFLDNLEHKMDDSFKSKFLTTAAVDEVDVIYRIKLPHTIDLTDMSASGVRCVAAPSGLSPSGASQIWVEQINDLEAFYYNVLPTRLEVIASGDYTSTVSEISWHAKPSGILDLHQKYVDFWKVEHDLVWAYDGMMKKQDRESMGTYEEYTPTSYGTLTDMYFYDDMLWWIGNTGGSYYLNISNPKTRIPQSQYLDLLATFDLTNTITQHEPSGIIIDEERNIWICDTTKTKQYKLKPCYDYWILDKENRYCYFREDYRDSGVFVSNL